MVRRMNKKSPKKALSTKATISCYSESTSQAPERAGSIADSVESGGSTQSDFASAAGSPSQTAQESPSRTRCSSEGDMLATSTPDHGCKTVLSQKLRSDAPLLRIKAQIRAASEANIERSLVQAEEPKEAGGDEDSYFVSDISAVGGGALHEMPRLANTLLQKTKSRLEESRNISREIREDVCSGLHGLHEMIMRLADSRNRHIADKERAKVSYERRISQMEAKHTAAWKAHVGSLEEAHKEATMAIKATQKETEAVRWIALEAEELLKEHAKTLEGKSLKENAPAIPSEPLDAIQCDIALLRLEVGNLSQAILESTPPKQTQSPSSEFRHIERIGNPREVKTYAGIVSQPKPETRQQFPLLVESTDPRDTGDEVIKKLKTSVNVIELGVGIGSIRKRKNQKVLVACDSKQERDIMEKAIREGPRKLTVSQIKAKNPLLKLTGVIRETTDKNLEEAILNQNRSLLVDIANQEERAVRVVRRTKGRTTEICNVVIEVSPSLHRSLRDQKLRIGYQVIPASDQSPIVQCFRCMGFGHFAKECHSHQICGHCAGAHDSRECLNKSEAPQCANCTSKEAKHPAYSPTCPEWQRWDRIARSSVQYC
ncbi:uncharacterized protein LOC112057620 [Bicyclus anynana]|uniref:Uncharacterized protein LOC112057620 n=1 Tax=Bicyclus anynana TaxID=110368 RepID=A0A6J1P7P4_BICAN|nr:uncharacterized protein LOC112057620 [Bicyclus anynana]